MPDNRKYRQPGYQDHGREQREKTAPGQKPRPQDAIGPRTPRMPGTRTVARCAGCGALLPALTEPLGQCARCGFELHSCRQCKHFDPASRFECTQPIPERLPQKDARNDCSFFTLRMSVERETSPGGSRPDDARRAFDNLFKN